MSKLRGICFGILLIALAVGVSGCFGSSTLISDNGIPMVPNRTMINAELPYVPKALTGEDVGGKTVKSLPLPTDNDGWGNFEVVPQIGVNYNGWVDSLKQPIGIMLNIGPEDTTFTNRGNEWAVTYEQSPDPEYDVKLTFTLPSTGEIMAILWRKNDGSKYNYVAGMEQRQLKFEYDGYENHVIALFYRKDIANMNDIVEVWEDSSYKRIKCLRVYDIDSPKPFTVDFASVVDISDLENRTTGIVYHEGIESKQSPAVFNDSQQLVAVGLTEEEFQASHANYPTRALVDSVRSMGVTLQTVTGARLDQTTLESNI
jgi:hypothetical protein